MSASQRVIGWGYEGKCGDDLLEFVNDNSAVTVVDVRLHAVSKKPDFRKRALAERLERAGMQSLHLPQLGNPEDYRGAFASPDSPEAKVARERFVTEMTRDLDAQDALSACGVHRGGRRDPLPPIAGARGDALRDDRDLEANRRLRAVALFRAEASEHQE